VAGLSVALPHPPSADELSLVLIAAPMVVVGALVCLFAERVPRVASHLLLAAAPPLAALMTLEAEVAAGIYGSILVWATMMAAYFFSKRVAVAQLAWTLLVNAATLAVVPSTAGFSPFTRWLFTAISLTVILLFVSSIVAHRARADHRARSFFDLSQDMLCTLDSEGRIVEVNGAWQRNLGYTRGSCGARLFSTSPIPTTARRRSRRPCGCSKGSPPRDSRTGSSPRTAASTGCARVQPWPPGTGCSTPAPPISPS
ncbi:MAG TPA: PAS domain S-box protein, partial [Solirubrobacterales bacterium]|nr:PAS domain S-box protein [Solirubrobacterales bacterium]